MLIRPAVPVYSPLRKQPVAIVPGSSSSLVLTIVIPCYNERDHIANCLESLLDNELDREAWEILVVDGMSNDGTRRIVAEFTERNPFVRLVDNPARTKPAALNLGLAESRGEFLMRIDAHSVYEPGYVDTLLAEIKKGEVQNVGGVQVPHSEGRGFWGTAIAVAVSHPLAMGNAIHRLELVTEPRLVDTVFCGCYPRSVFDNIGTFNEKLIRTQDREFNERLLDSGGKILLLPHVKARYTPRTDLRSYLSWTYQGAKWLFKARHYTSVTMIRIRNLIPLLFVAYLVGATAIASGGFEASIGVRLAAILPAAVYVLVSMAEGVRLAVAKSRPALAVSFPLIVLFTHISYGLGSLAGILSVAERESSD